jgi:hypothetical protein
MQTLARMEPVAAGPASSGAVDAVAALHLMVHLDAHTEAAAVVHDRAQPVALAFRA